MYSLSVDEQLTITLVHSHCPHCVVLVLYSSYYRGKPSTKLVVPALNHSVATNFLMSEYCPKPPAINHYYLAITELERPD